jgi:hypothetical protein
MRVLDWPEESLNGALGFGEARFSRYFFFSRFFYLFVRNHKETAADWCELAARPAPLYSSGRLVQLHGAGIFRKVVARNSTP